MMYNQSMANTYNNYGGVDPDIFDGQGNPAIRTNMAIMDSQDRFLPRQNSGAIRAMQMHQNLDNMVN